MPKSLPKVLLLADRYEVRGSSSYTLRLAEHIASDEFNVEVICSDARWEYPLRSTSTPTHVYPHMKLPIWGRVVLKSVKRDLLDDPPALIHIQSRHLLAEGQWLARQFGCPVAITVHDYLHPAERFHCDPRITKKIIAVSESVQAELIERTQLPEETFTVIHPGVDISHQPGNGSILGKDHIPIVGSAGPLESTKGLPFFLGAAQKVLSRFPDVEFLVSGTGPEEHNLRRLARDLKISKQITFVSNMHDFSVSLAAMDIFCLPSLRQGFGTIMLEAMAMNRPVIASGVGGVFSVIRNNETGIVVPPSDSQSLADEILSLLKDPDRARQIGDAGRQEVEQQFNVQKMVRLTAKLYQSILDKSTDEQQ